MGESCTRCPDGNRRHRAFTLVEIMVVVTMIGILAMLGLPAIKKANLRTKGTAFLNDGRVFAEAFQRYAAESGGFPATQGAAGVFPAEMTGLLTPDMWLNPTPLNGNYMWDDQKSEGSAVAQGAIVVIGSTLPLDDLRLIDDWVDDGVLGSGQFQVRAAGAQILYVLGE